MHHATYGDDNMINDTISTISCHIFSTLGATDEHPIDLQLVIDDNNDSVSGTRFKINL